ncbi:OmpA family protein [Emticicia sp. 17c]|uniref:OmpA family protein n=1 Tax=Emticicia sp. 17c TaxID=3127704 RepID=UPI00301D0ED2
MRSLVIFIAITTFTICSASANDYSNKKSFLDSTYTFGAFDKLTGKRIPALFKIFYQGGTPLSIQGTTQSDVQFKPASKGKYDIEISCSGYVTKRIPLDLENLGAGKTNFKEFLEKEMDEYTILVTDAQDKQIITTAKIRVYDNSKQEAEAKINPKTGEWKAFLDKTKAYNIDIEAPGYQSTSMEIQALSANKVSNNYSKFFSVSLQKNASHTIAFAAIDAITKKTIMANYRILRPEETILTGKSDENNPFKIEVSPQKKFTVEVSAEGYKTITEPMAIDAAKIGDVKLSLKKFEMQRSLYSFLFKIIDAQTRENIISTKLRIINLSNKQSIAAKIEKDGFSANLSPDTEYSIEVESEGYVQAKQDINLKELIAKNIFEQEILLNKKDTEIYKLIVVDEQTTSLVPGANLRVFNAKPEPIPVSPMASQAEWLADLKKDESYTVEVKMQGYLAYRAALVKNNKNIYVRIRKVPVPDIYFITTDYYTKNLLPATYQLKEGVTPVEGTINAEKTRFKAQLMNDKSYEIEVVTDGYPTYKSIVSTAKAVNNMVTIELRKSAYTFKFMPVDSKTRQPIPDVKITLTGSENMQTANQDYTVTLNPEKKYTLKAQITNYQTYNENLDLLTIATKTDFKHEILMEKVEIKETPKPKTEEKPKVETQVKEAVAPPPVIVTKQPEPKEPEKKATETKAVAAIADAYFKDLEVGKRIKLENVYFDQSQPTIKPQSFTELDKLVNTLKLNPKISIEIIGHTDNVGDPRMNLYLSELRAKAVSNYLFNKGIAPNRLTHTGKGQTEPVAANDTEENRQKNRRVEFVVLEAQ